MGQIGTRDESLGVCALENTFLVAALVGARRVNLRVRYQAMASAHERSPASRVPPLIATDPLYNPCELVEPSLGC